MGNTPQIGAKGQYTLLTPFDTKLVSGASYTCVAIRKLTDFTELNQNPKILFYDANSLDPSIWERDRLDPTLSIVTLYSASGQWLYVPSSFIVSYPDLGGMPYTVKVLGINLGAIADSLDLSNLITSTQNLVHDTIGITSTAKLVVVSDTKLLTKEDSDAIEQARLSLITETQTDRAKSLAYEQTITALQAQIQALEAYIEANVPPPPTP